MCIALNAIGYCEILEQGARTSMSTTKMDGEAHANGIVLPVAPDEAVSRRIEQVAAG